MVQRQHSAGFTNVHHQCHRIEKFATESIFWLNGKVIKIPLYCLAALLLVPSASCSLFKKKHKPTPPSSNVRLSGRVYNVNKSAGFVLIRRYGSWRVDEGQLVESRGEGRTASLMPTGERLGEHIAADIRQGEVEVGDPVYIRRVSTPDKKKPTENPENVTEPNSQENRPKPS